MTEQKYALIYRDETQGWSPVPNGDFASEEEANEAIGALREQEHWVNTEFAIEPLLDAEVEDDESPAWTLSGYWNAVLGAHRDAGDVVAEFELTADGLDEWLGHAEEAARVAGGLRETPEEWEAFHAKALSELTSAIEGSK